MAAINQRIPNFLGGVSQQPDSIKFTGQLRVCDNAVPDVTFGLIKRPAAEFIAKLTNAQSEGGMWYQLQRDDDERFVMQIISSTTASDQQIRVWTLQDITAATGFYNTVPKPGGGNYGNGDVIPAGTELTVKNNGSNTWNSTYLQREMDGNNIKAKLPYAICQIADTTVISNPEEYVATTHDKPVLDGSKSSTHTSGKSKCFVTLDTVSHNSEYVIYKATDGGTATAPIPYTMYRVTQVTAQTMPPDGNTTGEATSGLNPAWATSGRSGQFVWPHTLQGSSNSSINTDPYYNGGTETNVISQYAGQKGFGDTGGGNANAALEGEEQAQGHLLVNASTFIAKQVQKFDGDGTEAKDFIGYQAIYKTKYYGTIALKDGGRFLTDTTNDALHKFNDNGTRHSSDELTVNVLGKEWRIRIEAMKPFKTYDPVAYKHNNSNNDADYAYYRTPETANDGTLSKLEILTGLRNKILGTTDGTTASGSGKDVDPLQLGTSRKCEVIGDGLYIEGNNCGDIAFTGAGMGTGMTVFSTIVEDVSKLPNQCKHTYLVKVANSEETDADDYYLMFEGQSARGSGSWMEVPRPHNLTGKTEVRVINGSNTTCAVEQYGLNPDTMPHALNLDRPSGTFNFKPIPLGGHDLQGNVTYTYKGAVSSGVNDNLPPSNNPGKPLEWKIRECGDMTTNGSPSFVGQPIQQIFFYRNRLCFGSWSKLVMSQPNDFFNFYRVSSLSASDADPIDISLNDNKPSFINHALVKQKGVLLFADEAQFLLFADADILSGKTVRIKKIADVPCDKRVGPVDMGTSVMWTSTYGAYARAYETKILDGDTAPAIVEQTRVVPEYLPKDITNVSVEPGAGLVAYGKNADHRLWFYKYFDVGDRREQTAWFTWHQTGSTKHFFFDNNKLYTVTLNAGELKLCKHEFITETTTERSYTVGDEPTVWPGVMNTSRRFEACLDQMVIWNTTGPGSSSHTTDGMAMSYSATTGKTAVTMPYTVSKDKEVLGVILSGFNAGVVLTPDTLSSNSTTIYFNEDITSFRVAIGYKYTTTVEFPNFYYSLNPGQPGAYDLDGDLRISGINFELGLSGPMEFNLYSTLKDWDHTSSSNVSDYTSTPDIADYTQYESGILLDSGRMNIVPSEFTKSVRVPIQRKNDKYTLKLKVPDPFSIALISASWDGRYNTRRHVRR